MSTVMSIHSIASPPLPSPLVVQSHALHQDVACAVPAIESFSSSSITRAITLLAENVWGNVPGAERLYSRGLHPAKALSELAGDVGPEKALDELTLALRAHQQSASRMKSSAVEALCARNISPNIFGE
jgi:hypothetical protein